MLPFFHKHNSSRIRFIHNFAKGLRHRLCSLLCIGTLILLPCGCAGAGGPADENSQSPSMENLPAPSKENRSSKEDFSAFLDEFFREYVTSDSLSLHYTVAHPEQLNLPMPPVSLGHFSLASLTESNENAKKYLDRLHRFSKETLTADQQLHYDLIEYALENSILPEEALLYDTPLGPSTGLQTQLPVLLAEYRFSSLQDVKEYFLLLEDMPRYFSELCAFEKARSAAGTQSCAEVLSRILLQCNSFVEDPGNNFLIESFRDRLAVLPELTAEQTAELCIRNQKLIFTKVIPAYEQLIETLKGLTDTSVPAAGLAAFPGGADYYASLVKSNTGSDKSIPELEQMLQEALTKNMLTMFTLYESEALRKELETYQREGLSVTTSSESAPAAVSSPDTEKPNTSTAPETETTSTTDFSSGILQQLQTRICDDFPRMPPSGWSPCTHPWRTLSVRPFIWFRPLTATKKMLFISTTPNAPWKACIPPSPMKVIRDTCIRTHTLPQPLLIRYGHCLTLPDTMKAGAPMRNYTPINMRIVRKNYGSF